MTEKCSVPQPVVFQKDITKFVTKVTTREGEGGLRVKRGRDARREFSK